MFHFPNKQIMWIYTEFCAPLLLSGGVRTLHDRPCSEDAVETNTCPGCDAISVCVLGENPI